MVIVFAIFLGLCFSLHFGQAAFYQDSQSRIHSVNSVPMILTQDIQYPETRRMTFDSSMNIQIVFDQSEKKREEHDFKEELANMVGGYPLEHMIEDISHLDKRVAALIVGIAKKESNWGKRSPSDKDGDCFNYWGYRSSGSRGAVMGYACFSSPQEAISVVGARITELVFEKKRETPKEMIIWKCGSSCAGHSPESVSKWISDVNVYYSRLVAFAR